MGFGSFSISLFQVKWVGKLGIPEANLDFDLARLLLELAYRSWLASLFSVSAFSDCFPGFEMADPIIAASWVCSFSSWA
ncbi:hypothetical protein U1Q18_003288 [Sarracenia purpurea var. burkii]